MPMKWSAGCGIDSLFLSLRLIGFNNVAYMDLVDKAGIQAANQWLNLDELWQLSREVGGHAVGIRRQLFIQVRHIEFRPSPSADRACACRLQLQ